MDPYAPEHVHIVQLQQPVGVVGYNGLPFGQVDEPANLFLEAFDIVVDEFRSEHLPHFILAAGVSDHTGAPAQQDNGTVAGPLHMGHDHQGDEVTNMEAVRSGVKANIESDFFLSQQISDFIGMGHLFQVAPFFQYIQYVHGTSSCSKF